MYYQVDLLTPTLLHGIETQGVRASLRDNYVSLFVISYSLDQRWWTTYQGNDMSYSNVRNAHECHHFHLIMSFDIVFSLFRNKANMNVTEKSLMVYRSGTLA